MLVGNTEHDPRMKLYIMIFGIMKNSNHAFFLTGSRRFGNVDESSDWDFFVQDSQDVRSFLSENGFRALRGTYKYENIDMGCVDVWEHRTLSIHVQLTHDVNEREAICTIAESIDWKFIVKPLRYQIWNALYEAYRKGKEVMP